MKQITDKYWDAHRGLLLKDSAAMELIQTELTRCWDRNLPVYRMTVDFLNQHMSGMQTDHAYSMFQGRASCVHVYVGQGAVGRLNTAKGKLAEPIKKEVHHCYVTGGGEDAEGK